MKIRAKVLDAARLWFKRHNYIEVHGPIIVPAMSNWPTHLEVTCLQRRAYLAQGLQPYAEVLMENLGKIFTISPTFRAERTNSHRHLLEYWRIEAEVPDCDLEGLIQVQEQLVSYICRTLTNEEEFEVLPRDGKELKRFQEPFPRIEYENSIKILQRDGFNIQWGAILDWECEKHLSLQLNKPFFISEFPMGMETFFFQSHPQKLGATLSVDLLAPEGYGEISTGGQPVIKKEELMRKMNEENIDSHEQEWYLNLKESSVSYSTFSMGVERLIQWICKLERVEEASAFPRTKVNFYP